VQPPNFSNLQGAPNRKITSQINAEYPNVNPSTVDSPFAKKAPKTPSAELTRVIVKRLLISIKAAKIE
jgi:hypothetical protein